MGGPTRPLPDWVPKKPPPDWRLGPPARKGLTKRARLALALGVLAALWAVFFLLRFSPASREVPAELLGVWTTTEANYTDRFLEFQADAVVLGIGGGEKAAYGIVKVEKAARGTNRTLYTFYYADAAGQEDRLAFYYEPEGTIRFQNQGQIVWAKKRP